MKNMKKLIAMMLMMASVFFIACDDDEDSTLSPQEAKTELNTLNTDMSGYLDMMTTSDGMVAMEDLMAIIAINDPFSSGKSTRTSMIPNIQKYLLPIDHSKTKAAIEAEPFDFDGAVGTYEWNPVTQNWNITLGDPANKIVIKFPTEGSATNNATITIHNYDEVEINSYDEYGYPTLDYYPTDILADLYVNDVKIVEIDLAATWITSGEDAGEPTAFNISVYLIPFEFTGTFNMSATTAGIDFTIKYNNEGSMITIFGAGVDATFQASGDPATIGGYIQLLTVKVEADVDLVGIMTKMNSNEYTTLEEMNEAINEEIDAAVYVDGVKAADVIFEFTTIEGPYSIELAEEMALYIDIKFKYSDGSTELAAPYFVA